MRNTYTFIALCIVLLVSLMDTGHAQAPCQNPVVPPPAVEINQLWAGADKTLYSVKEPITFRISSNVSGPCNYSIRHDRFLPALLEGTVDLIAGQETTVSFNIDYPCFLLFTVSQDASITTAGVAVDACDIKPLAFLPPDFDHFWDSLKQELASVPINPTVSKSDVYSDIAQTTYKMVLDNIDGKKVYGWISIPNCPGPFAAVLHLPSYGQGPVGPVNYEATDGIIGVAISIHDYDCEQWVPDSIAYRPIDNYFSRHTNYYKWGILGCIRAIDYIFTRPEFNGVHMAVTGVSQGGGLTLITAGLDERVKYVAQGVTALCNHAAFVNERSSGFPYWIYTGTQKGGDMAQIMQETGYYDAVHFACRYKGPSLNFVGYNDDVCPPESVFAVYNHLMGKKSMYHSINTGHMTPANFWGDRAAFWREQNIPFSKYWDGCPQVPAPDTIKPEAVKSLKNTLSGKNSLNFAFLATGDDLDTGTAYAYDIRFSTQALDESNFETAPKAEFTIYPLKAGEPQTYVLKYLSPGTTYFLGIRAMDEAGNKGPLAVAEGRTAQASGVKEWNLQAVQVFPNPSHSTLYISNLDAVSELELYSLLGQPILYRQVNAATMSLDIASLPDGMYLLQIRSKSGEKRSIRVYKG
jgi:cephalosporin-C deacetylase